MKEGKKAKGEPSISSAAIIRRGCHVRDPWQRTGHHRRVCADWDNPLLTTGPLKRNKATVSRTTGTRITTAHVPP